MKQLTFISFVLIMSQVAHAQRCVSTTAYALEKKNERHLSRLELVEIAKAGTVAVVDNQQKNRNFEFFDLKDKYGALEEKRILGCPERLMLRTDMGETLILPLVSVIDDSANTNSCFWEVKIPETRGHTQQVTCLLPGRTYGL